jgi:hypothetical protein
MSLSVSPNVVVSVGVGGAVAKVGAKPAVPAKPAHIRPGLKPVKIPTVDDKVLVSFVLIFTQSQFKKQTFASVEKNVGINQNSKIIGNIKNIL